MGDFMHNIGVVLSGCGVYDGSEIHEAVLTLLSIDKVNAKAIIMAPDIDQMHVINHLTGQVANNESRNVLAESARIARGDIKNIKDISQKDLDALIFPGGFGAAKNLSNFAVKGNECSVNEQVIRLFKEMVNAKKPIGAVCIAPVITAKAFESTNTKVSLTIGSDKDTASAVERMGAKHINCPAKEVVIDKENKIISTPAYMLDSRISEVAEGIDKLVGAIVNMI